MFELDSNFDRPGKGVGWQSGSETDDDYEDDDDGDDGSEADLASGSGSSDDSEESEPVYYNNRVNKSGIDLFLCDVPPRIDRLSAVSFWMRGSLYTTLPCLKASLVYVISLVVFLAHS